MNYVKIGSAHIFSMKFNELDLIDIGTCPAPDATLESYYAAQEAKPEVLVNCGLFNRATGNPVFTEVDEGKVRSCNFPDRLGIGLSGRTGLFSATWNEIQNNKLPVRDFVSAYPMFIQNKELLKITMAEEISYRARRTLVGWDEEHVEAIVVDSPGMTFEEAKQFLDNRPLAYAGNVDGGGSSRALYNGRRVTEDLWSRPVDNVLAFYLKKNVIYRVQVGAFLKDKNAMSTRDRIRQLPDKLNAGYAKCYIRDDGQYYRVQIGAFGYYTNAQKVVSDLASKGIKAFIVTSY